MNDHFIGVNGFVWWMGVLENRIDPLKTGRAQVRIYGWNDSSQTSLPTANLLWAHPVQPLNSDNVSLPVEGKMVYGFYMDGTSGQYPMIMGQIPGIPDTAPNISQGFCDPRTDTQLAASPRPPQSITYQTDGSGATITEAPQANRYPSILNEPTTSRIARNENISQTAIGLKQQNVVNNVKVGSGNPSDPVSTGWSEPPTPYAAVYPYDNVTETESGHVFELDDTPGAARIHLYHRSGTFDEYHPDGSKVSKVTQDKTDIILGNENKLVMGAETITVNGKQSVLIQGDCDVTVMGSCNIIVSGDLNATVSGDVNATVDGNLNATVDGDVNATVEGNLNGTVTGNATLTYAHLFLIGDVTLEGNMTVSAGASGGAGNINVSGSVTAQGDVTAGTISLEQHEHAGVIGGLDQTGPPISA